MPKVGSVEFEKVSLNSPAKRLAEIALEIDLDREEELDKKKWRKERKVHPRNLRYNEYSRLMDKFEAGLDIQTEVEQALTSMEKDPEKGQFDSVLGYWYNFAVAHPEAVAREHVGRIWLQAIFEDQNPNLRLRSYCLYSEAMGQVDVELLTRFENEVLESLPRLDDLAGNSTALEHLLTLMAVMRQSGVWTTIFERYFEDLLDGVKVESVDPGVILELIDFLRIYHRYEGEEMRERVKSLVGAMANVVIEGEGGHKDYFLKRASDDLASLGLFEEANHYWQEALVLSAFPASENPSELLACALNTGNQAELMWLRLYQEAVVRRQIRQEVAESGGRYEASQLDDVDREWKIAWYFAIRFHLRDEDMTKYLETEPFLKALNQGAYDRFLGDIIDFCVAFPALDKLRSAVQGRIEEGLTKINRGKLKKDSLEAINYLKAAVKWQKEVN